MNDRTDPLSILRAEVERLRDEAASRAFKPTAMGTIDLWANGAQEALDIGLVDEVVPDEEVYERARAYVRPFATGPALAYAAAKKAIDGGLEVDLRTGLDIESDLFAGLFATEDRAIGIASFRASGPGKARFLGR